MLRIVFTSVRLAVKDWHHEFSLSFCGVLALASMLTPLLVLHGVHMGVIERLRANLMRDPAVMVLVPYGSVGNGFDEAFINTVSQQPGCRFCIGRTRSVASELQFLAADGRHQILTLEATAPEDPLLDFHSVRLPSSSPDRFEIVLTAAAAERLKVSTGDIISADLGRRQASGTFQSIKLSFLVTGIMPPVASNRETGFVDMPTLTAIQDFRDGIESELLRFEGDLPPVAHRYFESFRAYARSLDDVEVLAAWFSEQGIPVKTRARDIAGIRSIDTTLSSVILLITVTAGAGFFAFMASTAQAAVRRKWKLVGMLRLIGFPRMSLLIYPVTQTLTTGALGTLLAFCLYGLTAYAIDRHFAEQTGGEAVCVISIGFMAFSFLCIQFVAVLASLQAAVRAASIEPSTVLRES